MARPQSHVPLAGAAPEGPPSPSVQVTHRLINTHWELYDDKTPPPAAGDSDTAAVHALATWLCATEAGRDLLCEVQWETQREIYFDYAEFLDSCPIPDMEVALRDAADIVLRLIGLALCVARAVYLPWTRAVRARTLANRFGAAAAPAGASAAAPGAAGVLGASFALPLLGDASGGVGEAPHVLPFSRGHPALPDGAGAGAPSPPSPTTPVKMIPRLMNVEPLTRFSELRSGRVGKFVCLRGKVVRMSGVRPLVLRMAFQCANCFSETPAWFTDGKFERPTKCLACRGRNLQPLFPTALAVDWQWLRLQELADDVLEPGRIPADHLVEVMEELVDRCHPGDTVMVTGVVKAIETDVAAGRGVSAKSQSTSVLFTDVRSLAVLDLGTSRLSERTTRATVRGGVLARGDPHAEARDAAAAAAAAFGGAGGAASSSKSAAAAGGSAAGFRDEDLALIEAIRAHRDPVALLVASLGKGLFDMDTVKLGLLIALVGGTPSKPLPVPSLAAAGEGLGEVSGTSGLGASGLSSSGLAGPSASSSSSASASASSSSASSLASGIAPPSKSVRARSEPHVLIVGDPSLGKTVLLTAIYEVAPRAVYVSGALTTATGLTAGIVKDAETGQNGLEAGAFVLADQGVCCIDEFDKLAVADRNALLDAMEQQTVTVTKAGVSMSLPSRVTVIAAANPIKGMFDTRLSVAANIGMKSNLLSRFDLVFNLIDKRDRARDEAVASAVTGGRHISAGANPSVAAVLEGAAASGGWGGAAAGGAGTFPGAAAFGFSSSGLTRGGGGASGVTRGGGGCGAADASLHLARPPAIPLTPSAPSSSAAANTSFIGPVADPDEPLSTRLRRCVALIRPEELLSHEQIRTYVSYAREACAPALLPEAGVVLQEYYIELRKRHCGGLGGAGEDAIPITKRQLEAMIRLAEARAKLELREWVTRDDALDIVALMREALYDAAAEGAGFGGGLGGGGGGGSGGGMSTSKMTKLLAAHLSRVAANKGSQEFSVADLKQAIADLKLPVQEPAALITVLNEQGYLIKLGGQGVYKLVTL